MNAENTSLDGGHDDARQQLAYANASDFFRDFLRHVYRRPLTGRSEPFWAADWWRSDEAVLRVDALWRSWESLRTRPGDGMSAWWRDHVDYHMPILMSANGPFGASQLRASRTDPLPHEEPPAGLFPDARADV